MPSGRSEICVSILPENFTELQEKIARCGEADLFEIRVDRLQDPDFGAIRNLTAKPMIVTARIPQEGGFWPGDAASRNPLFKSALEAGIDYLDIEFNTIDSVESDLLDRLSGKLVFSFHSSGNRADDLKSVLREMLKIPAAVYKLVFTANRLNDNLLSGELNAIARTAGKKYVIHAMGEEGIQSRLMGAVQGNAWTYVSPEEDSATAAGQFSLSTAREDYFIQEFNENTRIIGLLGYPVKQSSGWRLHSRLIHQKRQQAPNGKQDYRDFLYLNFPARDAAGFMENWKGRISGLSVTIPHKEKMVEFLDECSPEVEQSGVCNTVIRDGDRWKGFNLDYSAILDILQEHRNFLKNDLLIIGSGATTRSAITAARTLGISPVYITARNRERSEFLKEKYGVKIVPENKLAELTVSGIIQTTPVGMIPDIEGLPPGSEFFRPGMLVMDVIFNPLKTRFLKLAEQKGCIIIPGSEMYLRQAAWQFAVFSGSEVSLDEVRQVWEEIS